MHTVGMCALLQHYKEVFEPLLLEEAGAQVLRGIEEGVEIKPYKAVVAACTKVRSRWGICLGTKGQNSMQQYSSYADSSSFVRMYIFFHCVLLGPVVLTPLCSQVI